MQASGTYLIYYLGYHLIFSSGEIYWSQSPRQVDWLGKKQKFSLEAKRALIEPEHPDLSIVQQCELLGLARSSYYYEPMPEREENLLLMRLLGERTLVWGLKATKLREERER